MKLFRLEAGIRLVLEYLDAFKRQDVPKMMACLSPECAFETSTPAPQGTTFQGKQVIAQYWQDFFAQKKELQLEIEEIFGLGYRCVVCWRFKWQDVQGEPRTLRGVEIFKMKEDLICEQRSYVKSSLDA